MRLFVYEVGKEEKGHRVFPLRAGETRVGRTADNDVVLANEVVSRHHAVFAFHDSRCTVRDLKSHNGTWVNGQRVGRREVSVGDQVQIGVFVLLLALDDGSEASDSPPQRGEVDLSTKRMQLGGREGRRSSASASDEPAVRMEEAGNANPEVEPLRKSAHPIGGKIVHSYESLDWVTLEDLMAPEESPVSADERQELLGLYLLSRVSERLNQSTSLDEFLGEVLDLVMAIAQADTAVVLLAQGDRGELQARVVRHFARLPEGGLPISRSLVREAMENTVVIFTADARRDQRFMASESVMLHGIRGAVVVPLEREKRSLGALYLTRTSGEFDVGLVDLLAPVAHLMASGIERARLKEAMLRERRWRDTLQAFVPPDVAERLVQADRRGGSTQFLVERQGTALFIDWEGLNLALLGLPVAKALPLVNELSVLLGESVFSEGGAVVFSGGRGAMAVFGSIEESSRSAEQAVKAAETLLRRISGLIERAFGETLPRRKLVSVGVASGAIRAGVVGSEARLEVFAAGEPLKWAEETAHQAAAGEIGTWVEK